MLLKHFRTGLRNIRRRLGYTLLNVGGLALGIASCLVIFLVVRFELGYDAYNSKADRIYRVNHHSIDYNPGVSPVVAPALRNDFPELKVAQFFYDDGLVKVGNNRYNEKNFAFADEYVPQIFDYQWVAGDARTALTAPNSIVLTESIARKYFGTKDPMGQVVMLYNQLNCKVTGIIKDLPGNTSLPLPFMISLSTVKTFLARMDSYYSIPGGSFCFILLPEGYPIGRVQSHIHAFMEKNWGKDIAKEATLILQPLRDVHFDQRYLYITLSPTTSRQTYYALIGIALFIIVTACINFINLATGQAITRAKEVGVRKVLGASRGGLIGQFLGETAILVIAAMILGVIASTLLIPQLASWLDISISSQELAQPLVIVLLTGLAVFIILLAGLYPAFVLSAFRPAVSLKSASPVSSRGLTLRKSLVVLQFGISQLMIIGTIVVARQMDFFQNRDLGFNKESVISFDAGDSARRQVLWQKLSANPGVTAISFSSGAPGYNSNFSGFGAPQLGVNGEHVTEVKLIDEHYIRMFGMKILAGDTIARRTGRDSIVPVVVNETMIQELNLKDPRSAIGQRFEMDGDHCQIIGVIQDFQSETKHKKRRSCVLLYNERGLWSASARISPVGMHQTIARIGKDWSALYPDQLFNYEFLDDHIASLYRQEERVFTAFRLFSCIAIVIGCLGLYGLIAFATLQRTREVGIRKVLGATVPDILLLFGREFIVLIALAFVVAAPVAWFAMHSWLENFAYRIDIGWDTFVLAIGSSFLIAAFTISYKSVAAALTQPSKSLKTE